MNSILLLAALGIAAMAYMNNQSLKDEIENNNNRLNEEIDNLNNRFDENVTTPDKVIDGIEIKSAMIGFSSISDKYMNCAAGIVWANKTNESISIAVDSCTFSVGGYRMIVGAKNTRTITIPANGTIYQDLFAYENKILFATQDERKQFRVVIGDAQGHPGREGRDIWGKVNFDAVCDVAFTPIGQISNVGGKQAVITNYDAIGRYYGSTALVNQLKKWVRSYIS